MFIIVLLKLYHCTTSLFIFLIHLTIVVVSSKEDDTLHSHIELGIPFYLNIPELTLRHTQWEWETNMTLDVTGCVRWVVGFGLPIPTPTLTPASSSPSLVSLVFATRCGLMLHNNLLAFRNPIEVFVCFLFETLTTLMLPQICGTQEYMFYAAPVTFVKGLLMNIYESVLPSTSHCSDGFVVITEMNLVLFCSVVLFFWLSVCLPCYVVSHVHLRMCLFVIWGMSSSLQMDLCSFISHTMSATVADYRFSWW